MVPWNVPGAGAPARGRCPGFSGSGQRSRIPSAPHSGGPVGSRCPGPRPSPPGLPPPALEHPRDAAERMTARIFGLETEFGLTCATSSGRSLSAEEIARYLFRKVVAWGRSSNVFLGNGARLYLDVGSHPEYATAECDDIRQLLIQDKAGERIMADLVTDAQERLVADGIEGTIHLFKNNLDSAGNSFGCHENYLIRRRPNFAGMADALIPFLITRQILTGAGHVEHLQPG